MEIRRERAGDEVGVSDLTTRAFAGADHSSGDEARIVEDLRAAGSLTFSLTAASDGQLIGHVAFSPVLIAGSDLGWFGLGPASVAPAHQRQGIGSTLIRAGLRELQAAGARACVVLGEPGFYKRFGFEHDPDLTYGEAGAYFQRLVIHGDPPRGEVTYAPAFG